MARPLRIEFPGALYHITVRGDRQEPIYEDNLDRQHFVELLGEVIMQWNWVCHAYCLMNNHYHLLIETPDGNLSKGMRQLNGVYTQSSNRRHKRAGHLFQGRYKAILVDRDAYFLELARYVVLNPVRAGMVKNPGNWQWSNYKAMVGVTKSPPWLTTNALLALFGRKRALARKHYQQFVVEGIGKESIWKHLNRQIYLGNDRFIERMQAKLRKESRDVNIPRAQQRPPAPPLDAIHAAHRNRDQAIVAAYETGEYSYQKIAEYFGMHFTTVGEIVRTSRKTKTNAG
jgi:REP element-mobilizing transposase RayT